MKRLLLIAIALVMVFALAACGEDTEKTPSGGTSDPGTSQQTPSGGESTPTSSGNDEGEISTGGEVGAAAPSSVALPANVKMEISLDGNFDQTTIKIGNDYYTKDRYGDEVFFKYKAEDEWAQYDMEDGAWSEAGSCDYEEVIDKCFNNIGRYNDMDVDLASTGRSQVIAGVNAKEYKYVLNGAELFCWLSDDGISFNHNDVTVITLWDTSAASFGFDTP